MTDPIRTDTMDITPISAHVPPPKLGRANPTDMRPSLVDEITLSLPQVNPTSDHDEMVRYGRARRPAQPAEDELELEG